LGCCGAQLTLATQGVLCGQFFTFPTRKINKLKRKKERKFSWVLVAHTFVILATQEAEIRRIAVQSQSRQIVQETLS
jgi:hypothetical protein